jgi:D-sedoheptulose 7-phosphate isomerase
MSNEFQIPAAFAARFLSEVQEIASKLDHAAIERMAAALVRVREQAGRLFILGVGGSAANASHAVNDFRKLVGIEAYAPTDNAAELTARTNDEGWPTVFSAWLQVSRLGPRDAVLILSVGGGSVERNVSPNLVTALDYAKSVGAKTLGIVGRDGGYTAAVADVCVMIPTVHPDRITPHAEAFQAIVWHLLVSHPVLQRAATKWESLGPVARRAVFLDRDGVLNDVVVRDGKPFPPASVADLSIPEGTASALEKLKLKSFLLLVVTNQPDVARGLQSREVVEQMASHLRTELPLDGILTCFHDDQDHCDCRKPNPGLMIRAAHTFGVNLQQSYLVGDRWRDIDAGAKAGCRTIWIDRGYVERSPVATPNARVRSLPEAVEWILTDAGEHQ